MSYVTIYQVAANGDVEWLGEARNSHGFAPLVWMRLASKYDVRCELFKYEPLWELVGKGRLSAADEIVLASTFDRAWAKREDLPRLTAALEQFWGSVRADIAPTIPKMVELFRAVAADAMGACIHATSVAQTCWERDDPADENESIAYNFVRDAGKGLCLGDEPFDIFGSLSGRRAA